MKLTYHGPEQRADGALPLPEGWPAADHDEPDEARAAAKVASGLYSVAERASRRAAAPREGQEG